MIIILIGAPGVGKGTQAKLISKYLNIPHLSTGDMFRKNIADKTPLGLQAKEYSKKGLLVPDSLTIELVKKSINSENCRYGFLLDGFPRNLYQAKALDLILSEQNKKIDSVFLIDVPNETILNRLSLRRVCEKCGSIHQITNNINDTLCDCGGSLIQRDDDKENVVLDRLSIFADSTQPMLNYYATSSTLHRIKGDNPIDIVFSNICTILESFKSTSSIK